MAWYINCFCWQTLYSQDNTILTSFPSTPKMLYFLSVNWGINLNQNAFLICISISLINDCLLMYTQLRVSRWDLVERNHFFIAHKGCFIVIIQLQNHYPYNPLQTMMVCTLHALFTLAVFTSQAKKNQMIFLTFRCFVRSC